MLRKILPVILLIVGSGAGLGLGLALRAPPVLDSAEASPPPDPAEAQEFVKMANQFIVPVVDGGRVGALVVMSLTLEVAKDQSDQIFQREPKLRDAFLQVLFDHANSGGFRGTFTDGANLVGLRRALLEAAQRVAGTTVLDVLIVDIMRQDS